jgi:hypothetical protein
MQTNISRKVLYDHKQMHISWPCFPKLGMIYCLKMKRKYYTQNVEQAKTDSYMLAFAFPSSLINLTQKEHWSKINIALLFNLSNDISLQRATCSRSNISANHTVINLLSEKVYQ